MIISIDIFIIFVLIIIIRSNNIGCSLVLQSNGYEDIDNAHDGREAV